MGLGDYLNLILISCGDKICMLGGWVLDWGDGGDVINVSLLRYSVIYFFFS